MSCLFNKHFAYTRVVRPVARVLIWLPVVVLVLIMGCPLAIVGTFLMFIVIVVGLIWSFRRRPLQDRSVSSILGRKA